MKRLPLLLLLAVACGGHKPTPAPHTTKVTPPSDVGPEEPETPAPAPLALAQVQVDTPITAAWGAKLTVPSTWYVGQSDAYIQIQDPERDLTLSVTTVDAADQAAAFAAAWKKVDPSFELAIAQSNDFPGSDGWDALAQTAYVTPTAESRAVIAFGRRKGTTWHVALIDGKQAAFERRGAQVNAIIFDMDVPGVDRESWAGKTAQLDDDRLAKWSDFVESARTEAGVPGVAVAVVHGGKIVFEHGYGTRSEGAKAKPVKPGTDFLIGSTSKSLTTLLMARLIDAGKLTWQTLVTDVLPWFALGDEATTKQLTLQYTVCACTGMPRQDLEFLFEYAGWTAEQRLASMKTMKPTTGFGETFQYSNLMVATGGYVAAHVFAPKQKLAPAYEAAMQKLVFGPLGMTSTTLDFKKAEKGDWAHPHGQNLDRTWVELPVDYEKVVGAAIEPAGGVWSSAHDMAQFVTLELAKGKWKGKQLVTEENLLHRREPQVKIDDHDAYGLGFFLTDDHGVAVVHHGGNTLGFTSDLFMLPDSDIGVVVLSNGGAANALRESLRRRFLELLFDGKEEAARDLTDALARDKTDTANQLALVQPALDDDFAAKVIGTWKEPSLGGLAITRDGDHLKVDAGEWVTSAAEEKDRDGTIKLITTGAPYVGFELVPGGTADAPTLVLDAGQQVYTFTH